MRWMAMAMALAMLAITACSSHKPERLSDSDIAGKVLLESYDVDLTWGYHLRGVYIDGDGLVWSYDYTGNPWYPEGLKPGVLSARDMLTKHKNPTQIGTVDRHLLLDMAQMIKPASRGKVTRATEWGEGGGHLDVAYLYDDESHSYHEIILAGRGDLRASNSAPEAQMLLDYLRQVEALVGAPAT